jgi:hypothetical protein
MAKPTCMLKTRAPHNTRYHACWLARSAFRAASSDEEMHRNSASSADNEIDDDNDPLVAAAVPVAGVVSLRQVS